jgi:hypothetical protein
MKAAEQRKKKKKKKYQLFSHVYLVSLQCSLTQAHAFTCGDI